MIYFDSGLPPIFHRYLDSQALGWGLLLGKDDQFSKDLQDSTRSAGVTHLTAASGANIRVFQDVLHPFKGIFWLLLLLEMTMIAFYWYLSGESGSLWRASVMASLSGFSQAFGRPKSEFWMLGFVVFICHFTKWWTNLGFWLSWLAIFGVYISQKILSGESKNVLSPHFYNFLFGLRSTLFSGSIVLFFVSIVIFHAFGEWQPQGLFGTLVSSPMVPLYMSIFAVFLFLKESNKVAQKMWKAEFSFGLVAQDVFRKVLSVLLGFFFVIWNIVSDLPIFLSYVTLAVISIFILMKVHKIVRSFRYNRRSAQEWGWT